MKGEVELNVMLREVKTKGDLNQLRNESKIPGGGQETAEG